MKRVRKKAHERKMFTICISKNFTNEKNISGVSNNINQFIHAKSCELVWVCFYLEFF